jgi:mono/diheme cytochrome c family protein
MVLLSWPGCLTATQRTFLKAGACRLSQEWPAGSARGHHDTRSPPEIAEYKPCKGEAARRVSPSLQSASRRETVFSNLLWVAVKQSDSDSDTLALSDQETPATPESTAAPEPLSKELSPEEKAALAEGQALFRGLCSGCHGGLGRGGKGPDLTDNRWLHGDKDEDIQRVIQNGVPGTTMKKLGESLKDQQIARIIAYVRSLARAPGDNKWKPYMAGDPQAGEQLFFDDMSKTPCAKCHTVNRKGGRLGPTLDRIAARRS